MGQLSQSDSELMTAGQDSIMSAHTCQQQKPQVLKGSQISELQSMSCHDAMLALLTKRECCRSVNALCGKVCPSFQ